MRTKRANTVQIYQLIIKVKWLDFSIKRQKFSALKHDKIIRETSATKDNLKIKGLSK